MSNSLEGHIPGHIRVAICVPNTGNVRIEFMQSLVEMLDKCDTPWRLFTCESAILPKNRERMAMAAIENNCSHVLFIDSDMQFGPYVMDLLVYQNVDVIAANCVNRKHPVRFLAEEEGAKVATVDDREGIQRVNRVGTGIMLIKTEVLKKLPRPWFIFGYNPKTGEYTGEDYWFCQQCHKAGVHVHIDHDVSKVVKHIGTYAYGYKDAKENHS